MPPYHLFWTDERGNISGPLTTPDSLAEIPNLAPLNYTFEVFDSGVGASRCFSGEQGPINMMEIAFEASADLKAVPTCHGQADGQLAASLRLNGQTMDNTSSFQFIWKNTSQDTVGTQSIAHDLAAGNYDLIAITNNGCKATASIELPEPSPLQIEKVEVRPAFCATSDNGEIQISGISGGIGEYTIAWENFPNQIQEKLSNLSPAVYHFTVSDENNCQLADSAIIISVMELEAQIIEEESNFGHFLPWCKRR